MYDRLFGSIVFVPLEPGADFTQEADLLRLPSYVASSSNRDRSMGFTDLSGNDLSELNAMGAVTVSPVAPSRYSVLDGYSKVQMLSSLFFQPDEDGRLRLPTTTISDSQSTQTLYAVENGEGEPIAKLWVNSD